MQNVPIVLIAGVSMDALSDGPSIDGIHIKAFNEHARTASTNAYSKNL